MRKNYEVAIIGTGPSGAFAAYNLAKKGISTVIIDKETLPRYKICGGGLVYRGRKMLDFSIDEILEGEFNQVDIFVKDKDVHFTPKREMPVISMVMRDTFDELLVKKAQEFGVELLQNSEVKSIENGILKFANSDEEIEAKFIIIADGALSPVSKLAGFKDDRLLIPAIEYEIEVPEEDFERLSKSVRFDIDAAPFGYGWCFPKNNHLSVGVGVLKTKAKVKLKDYCESYMKDLGINNIISESAHGFVIPVTPRAELVKGNCFVIGDAAGFADPIVAEGISNALLSGKIIAEAIFDGNLEVEKTKEKYIEKVNEKLIPELKIGIKLAKFFYENTTIRNLFVKKFGALAAERLTDVFLGKSTYPLDYKKKLQEKLKISLPWM